jgi:hypothetical protein
MSRAAEESNRRMLRARDAMDRDFAQPLDIPRLAAIALRDPFGNPLRMGTPKEGPIEVPEPGEFA